MKEKKSVNDLDYDLELDKTAKEIIKQKAKRVLIQLPDGLKPYAMDIYQELKDKTQNKPEIIVWMGSCFGACDVPTEVEKLGIDMIVQWGHSAWNFKGNSDKKIKVLK
ncbi:MAG: diphthamide synthesis protein [Nanoarchaeota archaeon]